MSEAPIQLTTASTWFAKQQSGAITSGEREQFIAWLAANEANRSAWVQVQATWSTLDAARDLPQIGEFRARALAGASLDPPSLMRWQWGLALAASILLTIGAILVVRDSGHTETAIAALPHYETRVGERATYLLADGSQVILNTDSAIRVREWDKARRIVIERGQVYFVVAKNAVKPFVVEAGDATVTAIGTQFDVRYETHRVAVALTEGRVRLSQRDGSAQRIVEMNAGSLAIMQNTDAWKLQNADMAKLTSWRDGRLIFEREPLADVVGELNRYSQTQLTIADLKLRTMPISGVFRTGDTAGFARALQAYGVASAASASEHTIELSAVRR